MTNKAALRFAPAPWTKTESHAADRLIAMALEEDLGAAGGDLTSQAVIPPGLTGKAVFIARAAGVAAGLPILKMTAAAISNALTLKQLTEDGAAIACGQELALMSGPMQALLAGERTMLNFLQRLSGVATLTRRYVDGAAGAVSHGAAKAQIFDTRKTAPGWRALEKYAVRCGGGHNHRMGLYDGVLIKDNHLAALGGGQDAIRRAVGAARERAANVPIEIEVDTVEQLDAALACAPDIILLDNMSPEQLAEAVRSRDRQAPNVLLEASGGVTLETVAAIAASGVDRISVGAITHSAPALDIGLDYE